MTEPIDRSHALLASSETDSPEHPSSSDRRGRERVPRGLMLDPPAPDPDHPAEIPLDRLDPDAVKVIARLRHMGHQAYFVGGCVRDLLLGKKPKDFDVATSAHPGEVRAIFRNCRLIGRRFRLAHVYYRGGKIIEVATFRQNPVEAAEDLGEGAGDLLITRDNVFGTAEEDAVRRDFTVNGLFYDTFAGAVIDYVGGRADLEAHRISTIGDPEVRMREDPVRALRAVRFAARLGFTIAPETFAAMRRHAGEIARCAAPRLLEESFKILRCGASSRAFELLRTSGALPVVLPAIAAFLDRAGDDARRRFSAHLAALDGLVRGGAQVSDAALLGALLIHLPGPEEPGGPSAQDELLEALVGGSRLPRRIAERARLALAAQRTFREGPRRRQRSLPSQSYYDDALQLLEITVHATGDDEELLEAWKSGEALRHDDHHAHARPHAAHPRPAAHPHAEPARRAAHPADGEAAAEGEGAPGRKRRRRRGGRRRRRRGGGETAAAAEKAP